ncbi:MAG: arsinothricin resistance N-acetyltransferase ArsN1 [Anaerolineae bacterium]|nr:arsinothricin resistance N-acetyltransferase ArsN1 [Anaerolineae bacterium]NUQ04471.1 N-acetyltransferase family protein [Anaerolineae bacterium]
MQCPPLVFVRAARPADAPAIAAIYNQGITRRIATFETRLRSAEDILTWFEDERHPHLVAEAADQVAGWISASTYRPRECYAGIAEFSVYVGDAFQGWGIGSRLMESFLPVCEAAGLWKLVSRIFIENSASRALCHKHGFREVGIYEKHAKLDGVWRDVVIVERLLGSARSE